MIVCPSTIGGRGGRDQGPRLAWTAVTTALTLVVASCGLGWTTLAGIGWVESQHGTSAAAR